MEIYRKALAKMSRNERNQTIDEMVRVATAHQDKGSPLSLFLHAIRGMLQTRRHRSTR